jgi:hypothetical protein
MMKNSVIFSISQQGISADIIQNSAVGNFASKKKKQRQKQLGADKLVITQNRKLKNLMSLFSDVFSLPVQF